MKRTIIAALMLLMIAGTAFTGAGCASSAGPQFQTTRGNKPHAFRNRIHNPTDSRYAEASDVTPEA